MTKTVEVKESKLTVNESHEKRKITIPIWRRYREVIILETKRIGFVSK